MKTSAMRQLAKFCLSAIIIHLALRTAEVAIPRNVFPEILLMIAELRPLPITSFLAASMNTRLPGSTSCCRGVTL